jgi:hypothetical protein
MERVASLSTKKRDEIGDRLAALAVLFRGAADEAQKYGHADDAELLRTRADDLANVLSALPVALWFQAPDSK